MIHEYFLPWSGQIEENNEENGKISHFLAVSQKASFCISTEEHKIILTEIIGSVGTEKMYNIQKISSNILKL